MTAIYDSAPTLRTDEFADKIFDAVRGAALVQAMYLGDRLGWYQALADEGPLTAAELAHSTGTVERYAREWLEQQVVSGIVPADVSQQPARFGLPREYAAVLVDADSDSYMAPMARFFTATGLRLRELVHAYRSGGGVSWEQFGVDAREAQSGINRPLFLNQLTSQILTRYPMCIDCCRAAPGSQTSVVARDGRRLVSRRDIRTARLTATTSMKRR